jgi:hypothetical protein
MQKSFLSRRGSTCNSVMSRIRICVENMFAGHSTVFNFLSFGNKPLLGGSNITATFLMNLRTWFYGNPMTAASRMYPPTLAELFARAV